MRTPTGASPSAQRSFAVLDEVTEAGDPATLGAVANDVGSVTYSIGPEHRVFLLEGDLSRGIPSGNFPADGHSLQLPQLAPTDVSRTVDIMPFDPHKWASFRVYDTGLCSALAPWDPADPTHHGTPTVGAIAPLVTTAFDGALSGGTVCNERFFRTTPTIVDVQLRGDPLPDGLDTPTDRIRFRSTYRAQSIGGCSPVNLSLVVEFGFHAVPGRFASAPGCLPPDSTPVPGTSDFEGVIYGIDAFAPDCIVSGTIESRVRDALNMQLPGLVASAVRGALLQDPETFLGTAAFDQTCGCPEDCDGRLSGGAYFGQPRNTCSMGRCFIQLEPRRLNLRPDGLEVVIVPTRADSQYGTVQAAAPLVRGVLCGSVRNAVQSSSPITSAPPVSISITTGITQGNQCT